ncbi:DUF2510 domain-containing protein [Mariniluteicoccus flavus]
MSAPGWYPDPGGQKGMFRYWDGQSWSPTVSPTPTAGPPGGTGPGGGGFDPTRPLNGQGGPGHPGGHPGPGHPGNPTPTRHGTGGSPGAQRGPNKLWWVAGIAAALALVLLIAWGVRQVADTVTGGPPGPSGQSTRETCPRTTATATPTPGTGGTRDGRVYGGKLSYPTLPAPWSSASGDTRVPFGRDVHHQSILVEQSTNPTHDWTAWVASVLIAKLVAGDGFYTPQQGSEIVVTCIVGSFYGNSKVTRKDTVNRAATVGGKEAWLVESQLSFDIKGLKTKGELLIVMIVATGEGEASLFYASIPDTSPQWVAPARQAMADLRVEG